MFDRKLGLVAAVAAAFVLPAGAARADAVADFYRDKTVTVVVPSGLGASLGLYAQLVVDMIGKFIPGTPNVIIQSRPGAGGTVGTAYVFNVAPKDGTVIAEILAPSVVMPLFRDVKFDASRFHWLGSITQRPAVISVMSDAPAKTLEEAKKTPLTMGSTGKGSETFLVPSVANELLGTQFKIVSGYNGGADVNIAMERGEVHGRMQYWGGWTSIKQDWLKEGRLIHFLQYGPRIPAIPDVPRFVDLVSGADEKAMVRFMEVAPNVGMGFWVSPEVPADRAAALEKAFMALMVDPKFKEAVVSRGLEYGPVDGATVRRIVAEAYATPKPVIERLRKIFGFEG